MKKRLMWVSRAESSASNMFKSRTEWLQLWRAKPKLDGDGEWGGHQYDAELCERSFRRATGLVVEPGTCVLVEFAAKVVMTPGKRPKGKTK